MIEMYVQDSITGDLVPIVVSGRSYTREIYFSLRNEFPETGNATVLYISTDENKMYRWKDNAYVLLSGGGGGGGGAVDSVNGQTGTVVLTAENIIAQGSQTIKDALDSLASSISDIEDKLDVSVAENVTDTFTYNGDTVTFNKKNINLDTGEETTSTENIALANSSTAGLMSPTTVVAIQNMRNEIDALEGQTIRLLYTTKSNPTAAEIKAFVVSSGYTDETKYAGVAVIVQATNHIWKWLTDDEVFNDFGLDTVNQFTNSQAGIIKGSTTDGQIYAEDDGTGSVNGWSALKNTVNGKANDNDVVHKTGNETIAGVKSFTSDVKIGSDKFWSVTYADLSFQLKFIAPNTNRSFLTLDQYYRALYSENASGAPDLGKSNYPWKDLYLSGSLKDGTNSVTVNNIVSGLTKINGFADETSYARKSDVTVTDVQVNGTSIVTDNVANIPIASGTNYGLIVFDSSLGITDNGQGHPKLVSANDGDIQTKTNAYKPIVPTKIDKAVMEGLGNNSLTWSDTYKANARNTIGAGTGNSTITEVEWA